MKYLKNIFEKIETSTPTYIDELIDSFTHIIYDPKIIAIPYSYYTSSKADYNFYVMYGDRVMSDDREFLREIYGFHNIIRNLYNKDYFYIHLTNSTTIIIFSDYKSYDSKIEPYRIAISTFFRKIPANILHMIEPKGDRHIRPGIRYKDGHSSNLSLFDWIYDPYDDPTSSASYAKERTEVLDEDVFYDDDFEMDVDDGLDFNSTVNPNQLKDKLASVRSVMCDFEDNNMIKYTFSILRGSRNKNTRSVVRLTAGDDDDRFISDACDYINFMHPLPGDRIAVMSEITICKDVIEGDELARFFNTIDDINSSIKRLEDDGIESILGIVKIPGYTIATIYSF